MRIAIYVHGHPEVRPGGSEVAAYSLFQSLRGEVEESLFLASVRGQPGLPGKEIQTFSADGREFVFPDLITEHFYQTSAQQRAINDIADLVRDKKIDLIHFHHFLGIGVDGILSLRRLLPEVAFVFTAHEYLSVCARNGQMLMPPHLSGKRCTAPAPGRCALCLPSQAAHEFEVRLALYRAMFDGFDAITAPSHFLADTIRPFVGNRPVEVISNSTPGSERFDRSPRPSSPKVSTFGVFGQISPAKGLDVFLDAVDMFMERHGDAGARFQVHGGLDAAGSQFKETMERRLSASPAVKYAGPYDSRNAVDLMADMDWVVVPSVWWENAPVVIEEALCAGRPIICSNVGGMAEKVPATSGLHFQVGNPRDLCRTFERCVGNMDLWNSLTKSRRQPEAREVTALKHLEIYQRVLGRTVDRVQPVRLASAKVPRGRLAVGAGTKRAAALNSASRSVTAPISYPFAVSGDPALHDGPSGGPSSKATEI